MPQLVRADARRTRRLLEIHDVCPEHFAHVSALMARGNGHAARVVLAVIPNGARAWQHDQIRVLQRWQRDGHTLALHGWTHAAPRLRSPLHRIHQAMFSRLAAENLGLTRDEVLERTGRGIRWFQDHDFGTPRLYVPPAWALGPVTAADLRPLGIAVVECLHGFATLETGRFSVWPLVGFEADTIVRAVALTAWNAVARPVGDAMRRYRIVVHPRDGDLRLRRALDRQLRSAVCMDPAELFGAASTQPLVAAQAMRSMDGESVLLTDGTSRTRARDRLPASNQLRVLVALDVQPERNGLATYWGDLAQWLRGEGFDVALLCAAASAAAPDCMPLEALVRIPLLGDGTQTMSFPRLRAVAAAFHAFRPSVVVVPASGPVAFGLVLAARRDGIPIVACLHNDFASLVRGLFPRLVGWLADRPLLAIESFVVNRSAIVTAPGARHAQRVTERFGVAVREIATPLGPEFCGPVSARPLHPIRRVLYAGRLSPEKNLDALLDAAKDHDDLEFLIVGAGPAEQRLRRAAPANVEFRPWQERSAVRRLLDDSDVVVLPSTVETFGTAALEAMARAKVVVVSPACGIATLMRDGIDGLVLRRGETLSDRLGTARALPAGDLATIGALARLRSVAYSRQCVNQWLDLLVNVARSATI